MKNSILISSLFLSSLGLKAQSQVDTSFVVNGVCGMCQNIIEKSAKLEGVKTVSWDEETKILKLNYNQDLVSLEDIYKSVAAAGYDTEFLAAPDSAYNSLHACCLYREEQTHQSHKGKKK